MTVIPDNSAFFLTIGPFLRRVHRSSYPSTMTTTSVGGFVEVSKTGTMTTITTYYQAGPVTAVKVNRVFRYLVQDSLKSVSVALNATGNVTATRHAKRSAKS